MPLMTGVRRSVLLAVLAAVLSLGGIAGCKSVSIGAAPRPESSCACEALYPAERCAALLTAAAEQLGIRDSDVDSIEIAPAPTLRTDGVLMKRSGGEPIVVLARVRGEIRKASLCAGIPSGPACRDTPIIGISSPVQSGYRDVPCQGEPPDGCATPLPAIEAAAARAARPLRIERVVIPIAKVGRAEVRLGEATLPNGILTVAEADLEDPWPDLVRFSGEELRLEVRSLVADRPAFWNYYDHGWWPGTEPVAVFLVFDARHVEPGATITIRDLVVG